jgi:DNA-binding GntR family transcriptional regulator
MSSKTSEGALWTEPLHDRAASRLRDMIVDGRLKPGEPISEHALCEEFGISRTPLREALKVVAAEGLIELLPRRGAIVTPIVTEQLRQKFELVRLLEDYAIKRVCEHATDAQLAEIEALDQKLIKSFKREGGNFIEINDQLHRLIMKASGNQSLIDIHAPLWAHLRRSSQLVLTMADFSQGFAQAHQRLMKAILKRDGDAAVRAMEVRWKLADRVLASLSSSTGSSHPLGGPKLRSVT